MPSLVTERIESVKAGIVGAGAFSVAKLVLFLARNVAVNIFPELGLSVVTIDLTWLVGLAIGAVSGFLFGVTYRYIIRSDRNSHLNDGAVLAFGLIRGLALIENDLNLSELLSLGSLVLESIVCFAIARLVLDLTIARKYLKPFL